jgi:endonuclease/exonuclease/phosphatase family metal-dependent hydrolase
MKVSKPGPRRNLRSILILALTGSAACGLETTMERSAPAPAVAHCPGTSLGAATEALDTLELRWYRSTGERDQRMAADWCRVVGAPEVVLRPTASGFPAWTESSGLDIATWNMVVGGGDLYGFLSGELGLDCVAGRPSMRAGSRPFVLMLQEAWRRGSLPRVEAGSNVPWTIDPDRDALESPDVVEAARRCGLALVYVASARNGPDTDTRPQEDMGTAILSSLPLSAPIALDLPLEGGRKVAVAATAHAPGGERVRFVTVHLDVSSTLARVVFSGNQTRARQAAGLIDGLRKAERDGPLTAATVVGGDFNTWVANETALKFMRADFPESPDHDGLGTRGSYPADYIFFRRGSYEAFSLENYQRVEDGYGSDHQARRLTIRYTPVRDS